MKTSASIEMKRMTISFNVITPAYIMARVSKAIIGSSFAFQLAALISFILNEKVSPAKSMCMLNVFAAAFSAFFFGGFNMAVQILLLLWLAIAVMQCKKCK